MPCTPYIQNRFRERDNVAPCYHSERIVPTGTESPVPHFPSSVVYSPNCSPEHYYPGCTSSHPAFRVSQPDSHCMLPTPPQLGGCRFYGALDSDSDHSNSSSETGSPLRSKVAGSVAGFLDSGSLVHAAGPRATEPYDATPEVVDGVLQRVNVVDLGTRTAWLREDFADEAAQSIGMTSFPQQRAPPQREPPDHAQLAARCGFEPSIHGSFTMFYDNWCKAKDKRKSHPGALDHAYTGRVSGSSVARQTSRARARRACYPQGKFLPPALREQVNNYRAFIRDHGLEAKFDTATNTYKCVACDSLHVSKSNAERHLSRHLSLRPFTCIYCEKRFTRADVILAHMRTSCKGCRKLSPGVKPAGC